MKLLRRQFLHLAAAAVATSAAVRIARAQAYPSRPVRIVEGFGAGSSPDIVARLMGQWLSERFGQPFIIENRTGAGGNIAVEAVVRASPDGYALLLVVPGNVINETLYETLNFKFSQDIAPVGGIMRVPLVMVVNPAFPARTVPEFIAYAKANPGKVNMASGGIGTPQHVSGELFKMMTGVDMVHVPYRGALSFPDLLSGQVQVMFAVLPSTIEHVKVGKLRPLAITTLTRSDALPDTPTMADFLPGFEASGWFGIGVRKNTPVEIIEKLNKEISAGVADPRIKARLAELGGTGMLGSPIDFGKFIAEETEKWGKVVKFAGVKAE
jgi:tripartite-type tricarboxylate transporter receptor subunit TctC